MVSGQTHFGVVHPDRAHAQFLRRTDIELEVIPDHPDLRRRDAEAFQPMFEHALVRLADAKLALDQNKVKVRLQLEPADFRALKLSIPIRDQPHTGALSLQSS